MKKATANNQSAAWYILRTYPGVEGKVKKSLVNRLRAKNLEPGEVQIVIPAEEDERAVFSIAALRKLKRSCKDAGPASMVEYLPCAKIQS